MKLFYANYKHMGHNGRRKDNTLNYCLFLSWDDFILRESLYLATVLREMMNLF